MIVHTVAFQWKAGAPDELRLRAQRQLGDLKTQIPAIMQAYVGPNLSANGRGYALCATMMFADREALNAYMLHAAHQALVGWLAEWVEFVEIDVEA